MRPAPPRGGMPPEELLEAMRLHQAGRRDAAEPLYRRALAAAPDYPPALSYLGLLESETGRPEGLARMQRAVALAPRALPLRLNYALALRDSGRLEEAEAALRQTVALDANAFEAQMALGNLLRELDRLGEAIACYRRAVAVRPDFAGGHLTLGGALSDADLYPEAIAALEKACRLAPRVPEAHANLGRALAGENRMEEAVAAFRRAAKLRPGYVLAEWNAALALPRLYEDMAEIARWRQRWAEGVAQLEETLDLSTPAHAEAAIRAVRSGTNFYLHYQGENDRALQAAYGRLVARIVAARYPAYVEPPARQAGGGERIRVGFASHYLRHHSIAKTHGAWITALDRRRFETVVLYTGGERDAVTEAIAAACDQFHHRPVVDEALFAFVRSLGLDVLVYPDLGMAPAYQVLAALRLAPVQCNGLGHPVTAGLPTIDVALSSALMEPEDAETHYTEALVRLPGTGFCYRTVPTGDRAFAPPDGRRPVLVCAQNLSKLLPAQDDLFARIAAAVPESVFWFLGNRSEAVTRQFQARLGRAFARQGAEAEGRIRMLPRMDQATFYAMYRAADLALDGHAWSGCNTTHEALACGLPVVTWPGPMMRGRHTLAILKRAGLEETIAGDADGFVETAVRLATEPARRATLRERIAARRHLAFDDPEPIRGLEAFLEAAATRPGAFTSRPAPG